MSTPVPKCIHIAIARSCDAWTLKFCPTAARNVEYEPAPTSRRFYVAKL
jgi:hypothetical protein